MTFENESTELLSDPETLPLAGKRVAFIGKLGGVTRREAQQLVRQHGGTPIDRPSPDVDLVVVGADELPLGEPEELLDAAVRRAFVNAVFDELGVELAECDVSVRRGTVFVTANAAVKNEIAINQREILSRVSRAVGERVAPKRIC